MQRTSIMTAGAVSLLLLAISSSNLDAQQCCRNQRIVSSTCAQQPVMTGACCQSTRRIVPRRMTARRMWRQNWKTQTAGYPLPTNVILAAPTASMSMARTPSCGCGNQLANNAPVRMPVAGMMQKTDTVMNCNQGWVSCCANNNCSNPAGHARCLCELHRCQCLNDCDAIIDPLARQACQNQCQSDFNNCLSSIVGGGGDNGPGN